jgi:DNA-binding beta-propeller fold protein YncE
MVITALVVSAAFVAGATASQQATTDGSYKSVGKWGKNGTANGQFRNPFGIATDKGGNVYVADTDNNRVQVFSAKGAFLRKWGTIGSGDGQFLSAQDVAVGGDGSVWVADYRNGRVQRFSASGGFQAAIPSIQPTGVAVDAAGNLFVQELSGRVTRYDKASDYAEGKSWKASARGGDLEVTADGSVYAADTTALRVARFDSEGKSLGAMRGGLSSPIGVGADLDCNPWIGQISARRVAQFSTKGKLLTTISTPGGEVPEDIAIGPKGDVYVLGQAEVLRFTEDRSKPGAASVPGNITVTGGKAKIAYTASGIACPAEVSAVATLSGGGVSGKAAVKVSAGKVTAIAMNVKGPAGSAKATFKIVLKTNGRPTTQTKSVTVSFR